MWTKVLFKINDFIKGNKVTKHYLDVKKNIEQAHISMNYLSNLLIYVKSEVSYYSNIEPKISNYPIVNKTIIRANFKDFQSKLYADKPKVNMTTSGSTGTPFTVYQDLNKKARNHADTLYFGELAGYELGNKLYYLKIWTKQKMAKPWMYKFQNIVPVDVIDLNEEKVHQMVKEMEASKDKVSLLGYVSALEHFIRYSEKETFPKLKLTLSQLLLCLKAYLKKQN